MIPTNATAQPDSNLTSFFLLISVKITRECESEKRMQRGSVESVKAQRKEKEMKFCT